MNKFNFIFKKSFWKNVLAVFLVVVLAAGVIGGGIALGKYIKDKKTTVTTIWERGVIAADGRVDSNNNSIHTKDLFECRGLEIEPKLDANVTYRVAFYDSNKEFLEMTDYRTTKFKSSELSLFAQYARVEINAGVVDGEKVEIGLLKITSYSKQLKIKVDKKQQSLSARLNVISMNNVAESRGEGWVFPDTSFSQYKTGFFWTNEIDVTDANTMVVKLKTETLNHRIQAAQGEIFSGFFYYSIEDGVMVYTGDVNTVVVSGSNDGYSYLSVNVAALDTVVIATDETSASEIEVYLFK